MGMRAWDLYCTLFGFLALYVAIGLRGPDAPLSVVLLFVGAIILAVAGAIMVCIRQEL